MSEIKNILISVAIGLAAILVGVGLDEFFVRRSKSRARAA